jgi:hypothetical protein
MYRHDAEQVPAGRAQDDPAVIADVLERTERLEPLRLRHYVVGVVSSVDFDTVLKAWLVELGAPGDAELCNRQADFPA